MSAARNPRNIYTVGVKLRSIIIAGSLLLASCGKTAPLHVLPTLPPPPDTAESVALVVTANERGSLTIIDHPSRSVLRTIPISGAPVSVVSAADGRSVFVAVNAPADSGDGMDLLMRFDVRTGVELARLELGSKLGLVAASLMPDKKRVALLAQGSSELLVVDTDPLKVVSRRAFVGETLRAVAPLDDKRLALAASNGILVVTLGAAEARSITLAGPTMGVAVAKGGRIFATVSKPPQLVDIDAKTLAPRALDLANSDGPVQPAMMQDGASVLVADGGRLSTGPGAKVYRVGLAKGDVSVFSTVVGQGPRSIVVDGTGLAWTANRSSSTVTVLASNGDFVLELPTGRTPVSITLVSAVAPK